MLGPEESFDPRAILASLERNRVVYVLIGGLARVLRGTDEVTTGVDVCPTFAPDNLERLARAVNELDAVRSDGQALVLTEQAMSEEPVITLATGFGALNIVGQPAGVPRGCVDLRRAATQENLGHGLQPYVASAGDLAGMAAALDRDRDIARLPELRRIMELEADRQQTIAPPAVRGPTRQAPTLYRDRERLDRGPTVKPLSSPLLSTSTEPKHDAQKAGHTTCTHGATRASTSWLGMPGSIDASCPISTLGP